MLLAKNGGRFKTSQYEYLIGVTTNSFPATIIWSVQMEIDKYTSDMKEYIKTQYKDKSPKNMETLLQRADRNFSIKQIKENQKSIINYNCSREDNYYLFKRGINMIYQYTDKHGNYIHRLEIDKNKCDSFILNK